VRSGDASSDNGVGDGESAAGDKGKHSSGEGELQLRHEFLS